MSETIASTLVTPRKITYNMISHRAKGFVNTNLNIEIFYFFLMR